MLGTLAKHLVVNGFNGQIGRAKGVTERFAALVEASLDNPDEELFITFQGGYTVALEADNGRFDLRWRIEHMLVDGEEIFNIVERRQQDRQNAVNLASGSGCDALGHLFLEHAYHLDSLVATLEDAEKNL